MQYSLSINKNKNNKYEIKIEEKINLKVLLNRMLIRNRNLIEFKKLINSNNLQKYNLFYNNIKKKYDYILSFDALDITNYFEDITKDTNVVINSIMIDNFYLSETIALRRLYLGNLLNCYAIKIPYQDNRAEKLIKNYNVEFNKKFKCNKKGIIVIAADSIRGYWFNTESDNLASIDSIVKMYNDIKKRTNLQIELRLHPKDLKKIKIKIENEIKDIIFNDDDLDILSDRAYCIICNKSSIGPKLYLKGNIIFNLFKTYKYSIVADICLTDPNLLNPNNLDINKLCVSKRYEYLKDISMLTYTYDEINNGYLLNLLYPILLEYKNKIKFI
jgi:hypothetical protein